MSSVKLSKCLVNGCSFSTYHVHRLAGSGSSVTTLFNHGCIVFWHNRHPLFHYTSFVCNNFHFYIPQSTNLLLQTEYFWNFSYLPVHLKYAMLFSAILPHSVICLTRIVIIFSMKIRLLTLLSQILTKVHQRTS